MTTDTMRAAVGAIHQQIMNLPDGVVKARHSEFLQGFQEGHKAARHAAAELVSSALSLLRAALAERDLELRPSMSMFATAADYNAAMDEWLRPTAAPKEEGEPVAWMHEFTDPHTGERTRQPRKNKPTDYEILPGELVWPLYTRPIAADTQGDAKDV